MKRRIFLTAILVLCLLLGAMLPAGAETYPAETVFDRASLLDAAAEQSITSAAQAARERTGCAFLVATHRRSYHSDEYWGEDFLEHYTQYTEDTDLVLLIITLEGRTYYYDLYTYGDAYSKIRGTEVDYILDDDAVYDNIKSGNLEAGVLAFLSLSEQAYGGRLGASYLVIGTVCAIISCVIALIACICVVNAYRMKNRSVDYPLDQFAKLELTDKEDHFAGVFITKRRIASSSGGRGGMSRGGGGGHRGGR